MNKAPPIVLTLAGHDPTGGAGIQADTEALLSHACRVCSVITALTVQDSRNVTRLLPQPAAVVTEQLRVLLDDIPVDAIKIGLLGNAAIAAAVAEILLAYPRVPVVLDPVLAAGGGTNLADEPLLECIRKKLLPLTTLVTPNLSEAFKLLPETKTRDQCGQGLLALGSQAVLITAADSDSGSKNVINTLYQPQQPPRCFSCPRLPHRYHGSGCTLASAISAQLAHGRSVSEAVERAQSYTWNALEAGIRPGRGQYLPNRLFWMKDHV